MSELKKAVEKLDQIAEDIAEIKVVQASQAKDLEYHIRRSDQNEHRIKEVEEKLLPLVEVKHKLDGAFKLIGMVGAGLGLVFAGIKAAVTFAGLF